MNCRADESLRGSPTWRDTPGAGRPPKHLLGQSTQAKPVHLSPRTLQRGELLATPGSSKRPGVYWKRLTLAIIYLFPKCKYTSLLGLAGLKDSDKEKALPQCMLADKGSEPAPHSCVLKRGSRELGAHCKQLCSTVVAEPLTY